MQYGFILHPSAFILGVVLGVWRIAHDPAKVGDQVRLLTRIIRNGKGMRHEKISKGRLQDQDNPRPHGSQE
jgi:hypothetical protein